MDGIAEDFCFDEIAGDFDHFEPVLADAMKRIPALQNAGIQKFFCGPESFTPDVRYHLGKAPELKNCYVSAGLNSIGLQSAGGIGKVMSEWIRDGHPPVDLWEVDVRRNMPFQGNRKYLHERVSESLGLLYATHWPYRQYATARGVRRSAIHDRLAAAGACHGEAFGWERPNWYAPEGVEPRTNTVTAGKTGSSTRQPNTARCARTSGCSTSRRSPNFAWRVAMRSAC